MPVPDQIVYATQDVANMRHVNGDPNVLGVYGEPGWTCQDWTNGGLHVCTATGTANWTRLANVGATALTVLVSPDFGTIPPMGAHERTAALPGAALNDAVALGLPAVLPSIHLIFDARVTSPGVVTIRAINYDGGNIAAGVVTIRATLIR